MNERIRELALKCSVETGDYEYGSRKEFDYEMFANVIAQECADICLKENVSNIDMKVIHESSKLTVQELATKSCGENLAKRIKEHFGVEL
jgi:hypothetical protein